LRGEPIQVAERRTKRLTSPERFEIKQLIASGAVSAAEYPDLDEDVNGQPEIEQDIDIEVNEIEPSFLSGQTKVTLELSPVKIIKAPDGSLNRAALAGASLAKERRDLKKLEQSEQTEADNRDVNAAWIDPMAPRGDRQFQQGRLVWSRHDHEYTRAASILANLQAPRAARPGRPRQSDSGRCR
jgi:ATP-dependent RNA helicase DHX8/PRP22